MAKTGKKFRGPFCTYKKMLNFAPANAHIGRDGRVVDCGGLENR